MILGKFLENDPDVPALTKFLRFIPNYNLRDLLKLELNCLVYLEYRLNFYSPYDVMMFLLNHGVTFSDEDEELIERNKAKGYYLLNHSNKLEKLANSCNDYHEMFCEGMYIEKNN